MDLALRPRVVDRRPVLLSLGVMTCGAAAAACLHGRDTLVLGSVLWLVRWPLAALTVLMAMRAVRRRRPVLALLSLATAGALGVDWVARRAEQAPTPRVSQRGSVELTVLSHNVLFRGGDPEKTVEALVAADADVVALQEVTPAWVARLEQALRPDHPYALLEPSRGALGYALYSRFPLTGAATLRRKGRSGFAQCARLELPSGPVPICNVHFMPPPAGLLTPVSTQVEVLEENAKLRAEQWARVKAFLDLGGRGGPVLAVGDFNTGDFDPLMREITAEFVDAAGATALFPRRTFPNPALVDPVPGPLVRIDYILTRGGIQPLDATVSSNTGSDHLPVRAVLRLHHPPSARARARGGATVR